MAPAAPEVTMPDSAPVNSDSRLPTARCNSTIGPALPRYDLEGIRAPTLLISAEDDMYGTFPGARYSAEHISGARFVGYPTGGHLLLGHWKEACGQVAGFLSSQSAKEDAVAQ